MKKAAKITALLIVVAIIMSMSAFAAETRANQYIYDKYAALSKSANGNVTITFKIYCTGNMSMLGASVIKLYDANDNYIDTLTYTDYPEMMGSDAIVYSNSVTYSGGANVSYAVITFFAKNSSGYEYAYYTT